MANVNELDNGKEVGASCNDILGVWVRDANFDACFRKSVSCGGRAACENERPRPGFALEGGTLIPLALTGVD